MKVVVCIKQVPDTAEVRIDPETGTLIREGVTSIINPYDTHAIEAGLGIRDRLGADRVEVTVLTMGPPQAETALREALSLGVNSAVLLSDRAFAGSDTWATSLTLSAAIRKLSADIVICGKQAIDGDTAQVGPEVAHLLDIPHVSYVRKIEEISDSSIRVQRLMDDGYDRVESSLPVLITVVRELNEPRLPSLKGKMAAKKAEIMLWTAADLGVPEDELGLKGSPTKVKNIFAPEPRGDTTVLTGTPEEQAATLVNEVLKNVCR